jgi:hypothetical protein
VSDWDDYVAAITALDVVRREATTTVAAQEKAAEAARAELAAVRQRIALQRSRLVDVAARYAHTTPLIEPLEEERGTAAGAVASVMSDPTPAINAALQGARATLDAADATLSATMSSPAASGPLPHWPPAVRNGLVYGWYALLALVVLVVVSVLAGDSPAARLLVIFFAIVVPVSALALGWISVKLLFGRGTRRSVVPGVSAPSSNLLLGAAICVWPMVIGIVLSVI